MDVTKTFFTRLALMNSGLILVALFHLAFGFTLADSAADAFERFSIKDTHEWNLNTLLYVYCEFSMWLVLCISVSSLFSNNWISKRNLLITSAAAASFSVFFIYAPVEQSVGVFDIPYYAYMLLISIAAFIYGLFKKQSFAKKAAQAICVITSFFLIMIHVIYIYSGVYPISRDITSNTEKSLNSRIEFLLGNRIPCMDYGVMSCISLSESDMISAPQSNGSVARLLVSELPETYSWIYVTRSDVGRIGSVMTANLILKGSLFIEYWQTSDELNFDSTLFAHTYKMIYIQITLFIFVWISALTLIISVPAHGKIRKS